MSYWEQLLNECFHPFLWEVFKPCDRYFHISVWFALGYTMVLSQKQRFLKWPLYFNKEYILAVEWRKLHIALKIALYLSNLKVFFQMDTSCQEYVNLKMHKADANRLFQSAAWVNFVFIDCLRFYRLCRVRWYCESCYILSKTTLWCQNEMSTAKLSLRNLHGLMSFMLAFCTKKPVSNSTESCQVFKTVKSSITFSANV